MRRLFFSIILVVILSILISISLILFYYFFNFVIFLILIAVVFYPLYKKIHYVIQNEKKALLMILILPILISFTVYLFYPDGGHYFRSSSYLSSFSLFLNLTPDNLHVSEDLIFHKDWSEVAHEFYRSYKLNGPMKDMRILNIQCPSSFKEKIYTKPGVREIACRTTGVYIPVGDYKMKIEYIIPRPYVCYEDYCYIQWKVFDNFEIDVKNISVMVVGGEDFFSTPDLTKKNYVERGGLFEINLIVPRNKVSPKGIYIHRPGKYPENLRTSYYFFNFIYTHGASFLVLVIASTSIIILLIYHLFGKEISFPDVPKVLHYIPSEKRCYLVNYLFYGYPYEMEDEGVIATILDLARKGVWKIRDDALIFSDSIPSRLDQYEKKVYRSMKKITELFGYGNRLSFKRLKKDVEKTFDRKKLIEIINILKDLKKISAPDVYNRRGRYLAILIFGFIGLMGLVYYFLSTGLQRIFFSILVYGISGIISINFFDFYTFGRYKKEYAKERAMWESFRNLLKRYSLIKKYSPEDLNSWGEWLVYATALGVAKNVLKVMKDFRIKIPNITSPNLVYISPSRISTSASIRYSSLSRGGGSFGGGWSGGGGFGGGFGGGGGGFR